MTIAIWILCGLVGAGWMLYDEWITRDGISISDLIVAVFVVGMGPVMLTMGLIVTVWQWLDENGSKIIIKRRKNDV